MLALTLPAKILVPLVCADWHVCFLTSWFSCCEVEQHFYEESQYGILSKSDYLTNILAKYLLRVCGVYLSNHFLTNIFTHTKLHQHCWVNIDQLAGQHVAKESIKS